MNKYISFAAGISLIFVAYFYGSMSPYSLFGFIPVDNIFSLGQNGITAAGYIFGMWFAYNGIRQTIHREK